MTARSTAAIIGIAAAITIGVSGTAGASQQPGFSDRDHRFVGYYPTEKACWAAAADEMGRDPTHINYSCSLSHLKLQWALYIW